MTIEWTLRGGARAKIRVMVKRILYKVGYPLDLQNVAVQTLSAQAELLCAQWVSPTAAAVWETPVTFIQGAVRAPWPPASFTPSPASLSSQPACIALVGPGAAADAEYRYRAALGSDPIPDLLVQAWRRRSPGHG